ncbi:MAG: helix-turn-helix transcriptional regulator [Candidatus Paracaedibacteraceae bacterium]|nr:helix-turn-helix transcriptional regulator [Candidatus Paracaedibacteraceae bacterium]
MINENATIIKETRNKLDSSKNSCIEYVETINGVNFTSREIDIMSCMLYGRAIKKTASFFSITPRTVETHIRNIMKKLECHSREAIIDFIENSGDFWRIKNHYLNLLIHIEFEKKLRLLSNLTNNKFIDYKIFYVEGSEDVPSLFYQIIHHLKLIGINVKEFKGKQRCFKPSSQADYVIYAFSPLLLKRLVSNQKEEEIFPFIEETKNSKVLLLLSHMPDESLPLSEKIHNFENLNIEAYQNYYFLFLEVIKKILPHDNLETLISSFKEKSDSLSIPFNKATTPNKGKNNKLYSKLSIKFDLKNITRKKYIKLIIFSLIILILAVSFKSSSLYIHKFFTLKSVISGPLDSKDNRNPSLSNPSLLINKWELPFPNFYFTGREEELKTIASNFEESDKKGDQLSMVVCTGLGGVGKTEIAKNYIHNWKKFWNKKYSIRIWFGAEKLEQLIESYSLLGQKLGIVTPETPTEETIETIKAWLENHPNWLIVYDNAENFDSLIKFFPQSGGHILITSQHQNWPNSIEIRNMKEEEAVNLVGKFFNSKEDRAEMRLLVNTLHNLPLALSQAASYIHRHGKTIKGYLEEYKQEHQKLLSDPTLPPGAYHTPVAVTWNINIKKIKKESKLAYDLLNSIVYLYPDNISRNHLLLLLKEDHSLSSSVRLLDKAIQILLQYSMITFNRNNNTLSIHRLVQTVMWHNQLHENSHKKWLSKVLDVLIEDKDDNLILGGIAAQKESLNQIIQYYEKMPFQKKTALFYQSLGCCYLVMNNFKKAESCFLEGIKKGGNSSIHCEYGQALYLKKDFKKAIEQLNLSIEKEGDNFFSYFSEMEKPTVIDILQEEIDKFGTIRIKSSHLAYYLILKCYLALRMKEEFNSYLEKFQKIVQTQTTALLHTLHDDIRNHAHSINFIFN